MWQSRRNPLGSRNIAFGNAIGNRQVLLPFTPGVSRCGNTPRLHLLAAIICKTMRSGETIRQGSETEKSSKIKEKQCFWELLKMIKILFVCHGNICRSPMAEYVMQNLVKKAGLADAFEIASAATSTEEIGNDVHYGTQQKLAQVGIPCPRRQARQMTRKDYDRYDYLIGMDQYNLKNMRRICGQDDAGKIHMLLEYAGEDGSIADPWYTGNFDETYDDVLRGCRGLLQEIMKTM